MIGFYPCNPDLVREDLKRHALEWSPGCFGYETQWEGARACALCRTAGTQVEILALDRFCGDMAAEGLLRAALNSAAGGGAYTAVCRDAELFGFLSALGFRRRGSAVHAEIPELLTGSCRCGRIPPQ